VRYSWYDWYDRCDSYGWYGQDKLCDLWCASVRPKIRKWLESAAKLFQVVPQWKGERFALDCQPEAALGWGPLVPCLWADCWKLHWNFTEDLLCLWYVSDNSDMFMICRRCAYVLNELCFRCHLGKPHRLSISQYLSRAVCDFFWNSAMVSVANVRSSTEVFGMCLNLSKLNVDSDWFCSTFDMF